MNSSATPFMQEYNRFKQFANSLLNRSSKLADIITELQLVAAAWKGLETPEGKRVTKSATKFSTIPKTSCH